MDHDKPRGPLPEATETSLEISASRGTDQRRRGVSSLNAQTKKPRTNKNRRPRTAGSGHRLAESRRGTRPPWQADHRLER